MGPFAVPQALAAGLKKRLHLQDEPVAPQHADNGVEVLLPILRHYWPPCPTSQQHGKTSAARFYHALPSVESSLVRMRGRTPAMASTLTANELLGELDSFSRSCT